VFRKVVIANRGLVASRIIRTLRRLGVAAVAVYSEADAGLPYVAEADEAYAIGPAPTRQSYLNADAIIAVACQSGADAVHPGYGFLSENAAFAATVEAAGVRFIGPSVAHIAAMGNKIAARARMAEAGVPVLPASPPVGDDENSLITAARAMGFPLLVKAAAGGGGIGMQKVTDADGLVGAVKKTRDLSGRAFGDGSVYLERFLTEPRHIEFQMVGDGSGIVRPLFERDCSIQRRHQKVVEETPAVNLDAAAGDAMARELSRVLGGWGYASLGTVEMLMDRSGRFYFLEMNTRLQVEHAVTEEVTGLDLVALQVRIAAGERLDQVLPARVERRGHAIEARVYAEDPVRFLPSPGRLTAFRPPRLAGVRVEMAVAEGSDVTPYYDPMLALVVAHGRDRDHAIAMLDEALACFAITGVKHNIPFLRRLLASERFRSSQHHTTLAEEIARSAA
jgi:acetyl-CoA carboxylase biotin carboxylase subunit